MSWQSESKPSRRTRKPERTGSLAALSDVLPGLYRDLDMDKKVNEFALLRLWPQLVASLTTPAAAAQTRAIRLKKQGVRTVLMVKVANAVLASELTFQILPLKDAINGYKAQTGLTIDQIQFLVGTL
jgi:hypothetical protein